MSAIAAPVAKRAVRPGRELNPSKRAAREPFWDNVRFVAIALVVVGHSVEKLADSDLMAALYFVIYAFHMPLFAFVCGRFASATAVPPSC